MTSLLADAITGDTTISIALLLSVLTAGIGAVVAAVSMRSTQKEHGSDIKEFQQWRKELQQKRSAEARETHDWRAKTTMDIALLGERVRRRSSGPHRKSDQ